MWVSVKYPLFQPLQLNEQHLREAIKLSLIHPVLYTVAVDEEVKEESDGEGEGGWNSGYLTLTHIIDSLRTYHLVCIMWFFFM